MADGVINRKRKRNNEPETSTEIDVLERRILESRRNYNSILIMLKFTHNVESNKKICLPAAVSLCRVFSILTARGNMATPKDAPANEITIVQWLKDRYCEYVDALLNMLIARGPQIQMTALNILMQLAKQEVEQSGASAQAAWQRESFSRLLLVLLRSPAAEHGRAEYFEKYLTIYDDVRYYTYMYIASMELGQSTEIVQDMLLVLCAAEIVPSKQTDIKSFYAEPPAKSKHDAKSLNSHKQRAQDAWLALMRQNLSNRQRKAVLESISYRVAPWFLKAELLMDFLTDAFNVGGSTSLLALSGLFHLMQEKNLDYPQFYPKLYSLLDSSVLHSKNRSRFFRLLDTFLGSTHLPAALVASFIKRLARLSLFAPPSAIVVVVPWIYNLLKNHAACTFLIHRVQATSNPVQDKWGDPFNMEESDPMETGAIDSSLWEIHTLQSHYQPNVATIAKIISEQFTKPGYNLEDFLDHTTGSMLDAELGKEIKKEPEVEYEIPKKIFMPHDAESNVQDSLLVKIWDFS